ncbi:MAG: chemotaxis protein CheW [Spongiibacteraceae bacterium]|jgi:twitching motility protein PilI|nr:chemotaxis protein CheW [Spongiibacteraceae bacterium]
MNMDVAQQGQEPEPFAALLALAERSASHARGLPAQIDIAAHWTGVGFTLAGRRLVAPMNEIAELLAVPATTRLPGVQEWVRGVANVRGRLLPLIDLEAFFGSQLTGNRQSHRVLVLELGDLYTGLLVGAVHGMLHFPVDTFHQAPAEVPEPLRPFVSGGYRLQDQSWAVFSPYALARDVRFFNAAA